MFDISVDNRQMRLLIDASQLKDKWQCAYVTVSLLYFGSSDILIIVVTRLGVKWHIPIKFRSISNWTFDNGWKYIEHKMLQWNSKHFPVHKKTKTKKWEAKLLLQIKQSSIKRYEWINTEFDSGLHVEADNIYDRTVWYTDRWYRCEVDALLLLLLMMPLFYLISYVPLCVCACLTFYHLEMVNRRQFIDTI